mmetsp:Transcript_4902/g.7531  ORF Transcript_4902/g.7531 Transcript_4902/m.7531 type:complete len:89 (+) Transcript_4902:1814-2080(+)
MLDGQLIEHVPEKYLETVLPKVSTTTTTNHVIVLKGMHKFAKGKLLEKKLNDGQGIVQLYEDKNIITLSLDDIAEWCGPLDDDDDGYH